MTTNSTSSFQEETYQNSTENFKSDGWYSNYGCQSYCHMNPIYKSSYMEYGWYPPNEHTAPLSYHPTRRAFTEHLGASGMYRNTSLNTAMDPKPIY